MNFRVAVYRTQIVIFGAITALIVASAPSYARNITYAYTGIVDPGQTDQQGYFGVPGGDLSYDVFVATFSYDTNNGILLNEPDGQILEGGQYYHDSSPYSVASIAINGYSINAVSLYSSNHSALSYVASDLVSGFDSSDPYTLRYTHYDLLRAQVLGSGLPTLVSNSFVGDLPGSGSFLRYSEQYQGNNSYYQTLAEQFNFTVSFVTASETFGVPEPSSWLLLTFGFGVTGCVMRRRVRSRTLSSARNIMGKRML